MSQNEALLAELIDAGQDGITPFEAQERIGTMRLAARIYDLRKKGYKISSHPFRSKSSDKIKVALYVLEQ